MRAKLVDAHVHLTDEEFSGLSQHIINMMRSMNIKACSVSMDMKTASSNMDLAGRFDDVIIPFVGIHPWSASENLEYFMKFIEHNIKNIKGIGEIGLDRKYVGNEDGYRKQKFVFEAMLSISEKHSKPISVHSRGSLDDVLQTLKSYSIKGVLLHWFAGSKKQLKAATDSGYYVSYGPALVYSEDKRSLLSDTPRDQMLVETDGPVRFSHCFEEKLALPSFLPSVVFTLARTLRMGYEDACTILIENSTRYLGQSL
jgi:TatD DNase family protein